MSSHGRKWARELFVVFFIRALIPITRAPPPKAPPSNIKKNKIK
jgi:hypothetical protein